KSAGAGPVFVPPMRRSGSSNKPPDDPALFGSAWDKAWPSENYHTHHSRHTRPAVRDRSRWYWLLVVAVVVPLLTPAYNRATPALFGLPFFYWSQLAFVALSSGVTTVVYQATKRRR
ncbi:MAG TPA: DUF3311 domain-containing protein, partial [Streptosporangiaceae bacterium]|nr:DUF3311 domain-containing protein [Streptosporangiaceae bacterium]